MSKDVYGEHIRKFKINESNKVVIHKINQNKKMYGLKPSV